MKRLLFAASLFACAAQTHAEVSFVEPQTVLSYPYGGGASAVVNADFNGDGNLDIAVSENPVIKDEGTRPAMSVMLGNGDGTFKAPVRYRLPFFDQTDNSAGSALARDFDGDGKVDVIVAIPGQAKMYFFKGNGDGTFADPTVIPTTKGIDDLQAADLNGDGKLDIVGGNYSDAKVTIHYGNGDGTFSAATQLTTNQGPRVVLLVDVNGDNKLDILVGCYAEKFVNLFLNDGTGHFPTAATTYASKMQINAMYFADFDGDGKADLAIAGVGDNVGYSLGFMKGDGRGTFATPAGDIPPFQGVEFEPALFYGEITPTDLNGDGRADLVLAHDTQNMLTVALSLGNGSFDIREIAASGGPGFEKVPTYNSGYLVSPEGSGSVCVSLADFNGDGKTDIAVAMYQNNGGPGRVSLVTGLGNGNFGSPRSYDFIAGSGFSAGDTNGYALVDVNGDGKLDIVHTGSLTTNDNGTYNHTLFDVLLGNGAGGFGAPIRTVGDLSGVGITQVNSFKVVDMNKDGKPDLVIAGNPAGIQGNNGGSGATFVAYGNGDGTFGTILRIEPGRQDLTTDKQWTVNNVFVGDFNGDGLLDIAALVLRYAISGDNGYHVEVYTQGTGGSFTRTFGLPAGDLGRIDTGEGLYAADIDGDGKLDLIAEGSGAVHNEVAGQTIKFFKGNGDGTFQSPLDGPHPNINNSTGPLLTKDYRVGDFNHDGKLDLVVAGYNVGVYLGNGDFTFQPPTDYYRVGNNLSTIDLADIDGGGNVDIAYGQEGGGFAVLLGNNDGTFSLSNMYAVGELGIRAVRVGDLNSDGKLDAAVFHDTHGNDTDGAAVLINNSTKPVQQPLNISTRLAVQTGDNVLIGGFIITGNDPKKVLIRALGPSLTSQGVQGAVPDTTLELFDANSSSLQFNDNWKDSQQSDIAATGIPPSNDLESAIVRTLQPGNYTAVVRGAGDSTGVAIVEIYDLSTTASSKLANISTRGLVQTGDNVMIGGFIVGSTSKYIVRAIGPSLGAAGVAGALDDPTLELHNASGTQIAFNDNWQDSQPGEITATGIPPNDPRESAVVATLSGGNYTAIVRGKTGTGVALVEVFNLQ